LLFVLIPTGFLNLSIYEIAVEEIKDLLDTNMIFPTDYGTLDGAYARHVTSLPTNFTPDADT
jgi:hypothetical protein